MNSKTPSEVLFERFCAERGLRFTDVPECDQPTVDYLLHIGARDIAVEIKALEELAGWNPGGVHKRTVGDHLRNELHNSRAQIQAGAKANLPTILVIYNAVDPLHDFGTGELDFLGAMYGDLTYRIVDTRIVDRYHGSRGRLQKGMNTSFSSLGHLRDTTEGLRLRLFESAFARIPLPYQDIPEVIDVLRVVVDSAA
jgi:hypothetical protein